jgi:hypothetical protein
MGLADVQRALARLYTETELRAHFFAAPEAVGATLGLTAAEIEQLKPLSQAQTERFGRALQHKRRNEVEQLLPLSRRALGQRFGALFQAHADRWVPSGIHKHVDDALTFAATAARSLHGEDVEFEWLAELLRYEAACLRAYHGRRSLYCALFRMPIRRIAAQIAASGQSGQYEPVPSMPCLLIWARLRRNAPLRLFTLALPTH